MHCKAIIQMTHKGRVAHFRLHPPKMGSNFTEYKRGLTYENAKPMSVKGSVGYSAFRAGQLNRKAKEKGQEA